MKAIIRRLCRLEDRLYPPEESEYARQVHARIEEGRRRVDEAQARGEYHPPERGPHSEFHARRLLDSVVNAERARSRRNGYR
jgi:hypothetical protein